MKVRQRKWRMRLRMYHGIHLHPQEPTYIPRGWARNMARGFLKLFGVKIQATRLNFTARKEDRLGRAWQ